MPHPLVVTSMLGLGDSLYCRAILRELAKRREVYSITPWPQLLVDTPIKCLKPTTRLRTQHKNAERPFPWAQMPGLIDSVTMTYTGRMQGTMLGALCESVGLPKDTPLDFSGPPVAKLAREPYIIVRPVTRRTEWRSESREPSAEYLCKAIKSLRQHFRIISIADIDPPHEVAIPPLPWADETYHKGELHVEQLLSLVAGAAGCVGGVGWLLPACVAYRVPLLLVYGGCLGHNGPARVLDLRLDTRHIYGAMPDAPCFCTRSDHNCCKTISGFAAHVDQFIEAIGHA